MSPMTTIVGTVPVDVDRKGPGRPRSARVDEAIIEAVLDLLVEGVTAEALTIEAVATKAGVGKATIYRRWVNKDALLVDAVAALKGPLPEIEGDIRAGRPDHAAAAGRAPVDDAGRGRAALPDIGAQAQPHAERVLPEGDRAAA